MRKLECDVVIVGGAVAGAALAANLRDSGLRVLVLENAPEIPPVNRGDLLAPCTVSWLARLNGLHNFEKRGSTKVKQWRAYGPGGETLLHVQLADTAPAPHDYCIALPHPLLEAALIETAMAGGSVEFRRGVRVSGLIKDGRGAAVGVTANDESGELEVRAKLVAGCDGYASLIRKQAGITTAIHTYPYNYLMLTCERSPDQPADQNTEVWGAEGFCGLFPISAEHVRCPVQAAPGEIANWRRTGLDDVVSEMARRFPFFDKMKALGTDLHAYNILRHHADTYIADGLILIGDAAHCTPPYYGMGMNMAIRDGYHAARLLTPMLKAGAAPRREDLQAFEDACWGFNDFVIASSKTYGDIAAARLKTTAEVRRELAKTSALDPEVMGVVYADYDAPPPPRSATALHPESARA